MSVSVLAISNANAKKIAKRGSSLSKVPLPDGKHHHTQTPDDLVPLFEDAAEARLKHLIIEGGDGTVRTVLTLSLIHI